MDVKDVSTIKRETPKEPSIIVGEVVRELKKNLNIQDTGNVLNLGAVRTARSQYE
jgi:hypothetical protein